MKIKDIYIPYDKMDKLQYGRSILTDMICCGNPNFKFKNSRGYYVSCKIRQENESLIKFSDGQLRPSNVRSYYIKLSLIKNSIYIDSKTKTKTFDQDYKNIKVGSLIYNEGQKFCCIHYLEIKISTVIYSDNEHINKKKIKKAEEILKKIINDEEYIMILSDRVADYIECNKKYHKELNQLIQRW